MRKAHGPKSNIFLIAAAFVVFVPYVVHGTQKGALDEQKWLGACKLAGEFKKVQNRLVFRLSAPSATAQGYMCQLLWTKIIVEKQQKGSHSKKDIALINYYAEQAQKALAQAQGAPTTKLASALRNSAAAEAAIQEFINILGQISDGDTHSCLEKTDNSNDLREYSTEVSADAPGCKISTKDLSGSDEQTDHLTRTGANTGLQTPKGSATTSAALRCEFSQGKTYTNKLLDSGSGVTIRGTPTFAAGLFVTTGNDIEHTSTADLTEAAETAPLLHAAHAAYLLSKETAPAFKFKDTEKLAVDTDFQHEFIKTVLNQKDSAPPVEDIAGKIKKTYGQKEDMKRQYNDIFATTEVKNSAGDEPETKILNSITKIDELTRLLYFNQRENIKDLKKN
uniref:Variant surface glycoprotein 1468 n=1 Tax=Trypanosoma brucei TaxID=5691 RepID=M4T088_9TRYP|nr:variant surface glycoprotein 1468 [Trypanosoma brucei]